MTVSKWMPVGTVLKMNALNYPDSSAARIRTKASPLKSGTNVPAAWPGHWKHGCGLRRKVAILSYNRVEWMEIYAACAKEGSCCSVLFRLTPAEFEYIVNHAECKAFIVEEPFIEK